MKGQSRLCRMKTLLKILFLLLVCSLIVFLYNTSSIWRNGVGGVEKEVIFDQKLYDQKPRLKSNLIVNTHSRYSEPSNRLTANVDICTLDLLEIVNKKHPEITEPATRPLPPSHVTTSGKKLRVNLKDKLHVIVLPHSHSDPGWLKTLSEYFVDQTNKTLNNMVAKLTKYPEMTFVWSEVVFLSMWWKDLNESTRNDVRQLIARRQLEIAPGSWVVPDEANTHYHALIDQMILGHQWLEKNLKVRPRNTWSLDPFGYSALLPYLYKRAGYENIAILRVHKDLKEELIDLRALEFHWRQMWDSTNQTDIFTLMMPYMLYNIKHSCGPDQQICLKFDFRKIPGEMSESRAEAITPGNLMTLAEQLVDQYRKKASLYRHNVVLIPLGDDFRYDRPLEWDQQYENYMKLFNAMNSRKDWNVNARFGTLQDYYDQVQLSVTNRHANPKKFFPSLSGDFFPYTDRDDQYWTGYFTTRPLAKSLGRDVEIYLRAAEIINSLLLVSSQYSPDLSKRELNLQRLAESRQNSALFQHHDAITGTARAYVSIDYEKKLLKALTLSKYSINDAIAAFYSSIREIKNEDSSVKVLDPVNMRILKPTEDVVQIYNDGIKIVIYNSLTQDRKELIKLNVNKQNIVISDRHNQVITTQIIPIWGPTHEVLPEVFEAAFFVDLPALSFVTYSIGVDKNSQYTQQSLVERYNMSANQQQSDNIEDLSIENDFLRLVLSKSNGHLKYVSVKNKNSDSVAKVPLDMQFLTYKSRRSGAYIFAPFGVATDKLFKLPPIITRIVGPVISELRIAHSFVTQILRVANSTTLLGSSIFVENQIDGSRLDDDELIMRLTSDIINLDTFYTDQNGHHSVKRKRLSRLPLEASYYPASSVVYIEDERKRISVLTSQPVGASSQGEGSIEVMIDRRLRYDDGRGMGEGVLDSRPVVSRFALLIEEKNKNERIKGVSFRADILSEQQQESSSGDTSDPCERCVSAPSLAAHILTQQMRNYPIVATVASSSADLFPISFLSAALPCDVSLVNLRVLGADDLNDLKPDSIHEVAIVLHKIEFSSKYTLPMSECSSGSDSVIVESVFRDMRVKKVRWMTLSLMHEIRQLTHNETIALKANELYAFIYTFQ